MYPASAVWPWLAQGPHMLYPPDVRQPQYRWFRGRLSYLLSCGCLSSESTKYFFTAQTMTMVATLMIFWRTPLISWPYATMTSHPW